MSALDLFKEFEGVRKEQWLEKISADLKGRPLEELDWEFEGSRASPFYHAEDVQNEYSSINLTRSDNSWQIGEVIGTSKEADINSSILEALEQGVSAIRLNTQDWKETDLRKLLVGVQHEWISTHLVVETNDALQCIGRFSNLIEERGQDTSIMAGSILLPQIDTPSWIALEEMFVKLPEFRLVINAEVKSTQSSTEDLVKLLMRTYTFLQEGQQRGIALGLLFTKLQYAITLGDDYYKSIIVLRSLRRLIAHLKSTYQVVNTPSIKIETWINASEQTQDENYNLIKNTSQILSAVQGGADIVYPTFSSSETVYANHNQRISRNINHVLRLESYMGRVVDPAAGSYFFESMTDQLCKTVWREFQNRVEEL